MVQCKIEYEGQLHCNVTHGPSGAVTHTDAPKDNMGKGESFSPTDLVGVALASCMVTTMAIVAQRHGIELAGTTASVDKEMSTSGPRRIARLTVKIRVPTQLSDQQKQLMENTAKACPVHKSLGAEVEMPVEFHWG